MVNPWHWRQFGEHFQFNDQALTQKGAGSKNEANDIQITVGVDMATSAPPVVRQRSCSAWLLWLHVA